MADHAARFMTITYDCTDFTKEVSPDAVTGFLEGELDCLALRDLLVTWE